MAGTSSWNPGPVLLCILYFYASRVSCGAMASWWTDPYGATLITQDDDTGLVRYSLCNSNSTPVLPEDRSLTLPLFKYPPKNGTGLAGVGWWDGQETIASIFYQDAQDEIINTVLNCDMKTGHWTNSGDFQISLGATSPSSMTGLAVVLLGEDAGYRVFYKDISNRLRYLGYIPNKGWADWGSVSNDEIEATAIGAAFTDSDNITVVTPKGQGNMEATRFHDDGLWHIQTLPRPLSGSNVTNVTKAASYPFDMKASLSFTLPAWEGTASALGVSVSEKGARSIFYVGTDHELYQATNDGDETNGWKIAPRPGADAWPKADQANGSLAVASHFGRKQVRVHYVSGGRMIEARGEGATWAQATVLPNYNSSAQNSDTPSASASAAPADAGLTTGAKIGIGIGASLGALALGGMIGALLYLRQRKRRSEEAAAASAAAAKSPQSHYPPPTSYQAYSPQGPFPPYGPVSPNTQGSPVEPYGPGYQQPPTWGYSPLGTVKRPDTQPGELDGPQLYEMPEQRVRHELMGEGHVQEAP